MAVDDIGQSASQALSETLPAFKQYLDSSGSLLASDPNLLSYYALPYVRNPQSHPSFRHVFTPTFVSDLRQQLSNALQAVPVEQPLPRLYNMYAAAQAANSAVSTSGLQWSSSSAMPHLPLPGTILDPMVKSSNSGSQLQPAIGMGLRCEAVSEPQKGDSRRISSLLSGSMKGSSRPISALLNGSKELADLVLASRPRYADHMPALCLEPSADVLHGQSYGAFHLPCYSPDSE